MPYAVLLVVFVIVPLFVVVYYAFTTESGGFTFRNFADAFREQNAFRVLMSSLLFALLTSVICLAIAYPLALILSNKKFNRSSITVMLFVLPMWINFLLRTLAIKNIFGDWESYGAALIGSVYDFLPFMILPIYTTLCNIDKNLPEAAADLGGNSVITFLKVTLPLSVPGILSGMIMVFMPTVSSFAITDILGRDLRMFGGVIDGFFVSNNWNLGSALALIMLLLVGISVFVANIFAKKQGGIADVKNGGKW